ncbi:hypothetical protein AAT19DRAFT_11533 [Rhodotorula toruloides]|uniref:Uncharacterized protein n=1 Tax=Rhodotorula toruloides TaxID=5286 RepID=A0A2S9ZX20_RHOTO|nr:hypothetical protein AAT19DRAFT_11533 [Rhodotorula toruloides]
MRKEERVRLDVHRRAQSLPNHPLNHPPPSSFFSSPSCSSLDEPSSDADAVDFPLEAASVEFNPTFWPVKPQRRSTTPMSRISCCEDESGKRAVKTGMERSRAALRDDGERVNFGLHSEGGQKRGNVRAFAAVRGRNEGDSQSLWSKTGRGKARLTTRTAP